MGLLELKTTYVLVFVVMNSVPTPYVQASIWSHEFVGKRACEVAMDAISAGLQQLGGAKAIGYCIKKEETE